MTRKTCQICLESIEDDQLLTQICGKSCSAEICRQCMGRHVEVTLQQFYPGVLPRVRCPVCLTLLHVSRWDHRVPHEIKSTLTATHAELCRQACSVTPPCCHKTDYSHLPEFDPYHKPARPIKLLPSQLETFKAMCKQFCRHQLAARAVLDYAFATFGKVKAAILINDLTLCRIQDLERRATLLLSLMYLQPNTRTKCCRCNFCFNCKRQGHHKKCPDKFDEGNDLVRCRMCRALLLKVDGCDAVHCVCGHNMRWSAELSLRQERKKGIIPVDIFDSPLTDQWLQFRARLITVMRNLRSKWLNERIEVVQSVLYPVFVHYLWRFRFRQVLTKEFRAVWKTRRAKRVTQNLVVVGGILREAVASYLWRRRFRKVLTNMMSELFWKTYRHSHPEELEAESDVVNTLFRIRAFDEESKDSVR
ncbi:Urease accessory protein [Phytophthora megakarya]|uniref:Urease accessory protein n=1 Tax=Phytophthora megakarya TaxID=4795 RepID=A0A225V7S0_9STRA|nr:Urease accessory protein [Phytophthora megakarya]